MIYKSIFAIGDVHGCVEELRNLLGLLPIQRDSLVVFLGDYVDRGPDSKGVIDEILALKKRHPHVVTLMGNHEDMFLEFLDRPEQAGMFILNGGSATLASYAVGGERFEIPADHQDFLRSLQVTHQTEKHFFVHAGVPDVELGLIEEARYREELLWIRGEFLLNKRNWGKRIVHGHTAVANPEVLANRINLDTGCVFGNRLSAMELITEKLYSVPRQKPSEAIQYLRDPSSRRVATRFTGSLRVFIKQAGGDLEMEALNFNQFGMLLRQVRVSDEVPLTVGVTIRGEVGDKSFHRAQFSGRIVRVDERGAEALYGVQISTLDIFGEGLG